MPRVYNPTANAIDANGNVLLETGAAFPSKPSKAELRKQLGAQVIAAAATHNVDIDTIAAVDVVDEDLQFEITGAARKDGKRKVSAAPKSNRPSGKSSAKKVSKAPNTNKRSGPTKKDQAVKIYRDNCDKSRKQVIELLVDQLGMTTAGASTYYSAAKKIVEG